VLLGLEVLPLGDANDEIALSSTECVPIETHKLSKFLHEKLLSSCLLVATCIRLSRCAATAHAPRPRRAAAR
jgi:hypothetical protein